MTLQLMLLASLFLTVLSLECLNGTDEDGYNNATCAKNVDYCGIFFLFPGFFHGRQVFKGCNDYVHKRVGRFWNVSCTHPGMQNDLIGWLYCCQSDFCDYETSLTEMMSSSTSTTEGSTQRPDQSSGNQATTGSYAGTYETTTTGCSSMDIWAYASLVPLSVCWFFIELLVV